MGHDEPWILGVSYSHNGAACLLRGETIQVMVQEERLNGHKRARIIHHEQSLAVRYCLDHAQITMADVDLLVVCHFSSPVPPPLTLPGSKGPLPRRYLTISHHLGHAHAAYATAGFRDAAILVIDGQGGTLAQLPEDERRILRRSHVPGSTQECEVVSLYGVSQSNHSSGLTCVEKHSGEFLPGWTATPTVEGRRSLPQFGSLGGMYSAVADLIFGDPLEAGKVMGLAPYGQPRLPCDAFFTVDDEGCFRFSDRLPREYRELQPWPHNQALFADLAASVQQALEQAVVFLADRARRLTGQNRLCYAGGVALNSIANELLFRRLGFEDVYIMPAAEDSGAAIGAAFYGLGMLRGTLTSRRLLHDCLGRSYSADEVRRAVASTPHVESVPVDDLLDAAVDRLCRGEVLGWFQAGSELGPRALGQRSILCDARLADGKDRLNTRVKHREGFRPFAPAVLLEEAERWFDLPAGFSESPSMLRVCRFKPGRAAQVPAAAHIDGTGRLQTVCAQANGRFHALLKRFFERTGVPILLNTSYNIATEPIVESPVDALWCLLATQLDALILEDRLIVKSASYSSILALYPRLQANKVHISLPILGGVFPHKLAVDADVELCTMTPYGEYICKLRAVDTSLLRLCDGTRNGNEILEMLRRESGSMTESMIARRLCYYRRAHILSLDAMPTRLPADRV